MIKEKHILRVPSADDISQFLDIAIRLFDSSELVSQIDLSKPVPLDQREKMREIAIAAAEELKLSKDNE